MTGKIYVGSTDVPLYEPEFGSAWPTNYNHTFILYDADGDLSTTGDQTVIEGEPSNGMAAGGTLQIYIQPVSGDSDSHVDLDTNGDGIADLAPSTLNLTEVTSVFTTASGESVPDTWEDIVTSVQSLGTTADTVTDTGLPYFVFGNDCNEVTNTVFGLAGSSLIENIPTGTGDKVYLTDIPGYNVFIGSPDGGADLNLSDGTGNYKFIDRGGDPNTITVNLGTSVEVVRTGAQAELDINLTGFDPANIAAEHHVLSDALHIVDTSTGQEIARIDGYYKDDNANGIPDGAEAGGLISIDDGHGHTGTIDLGDYGTPGDPGDLPVYAPPTIPDAVQGCLAPWAAAPIQSSPLVIDLSSGHTGITLTTYDAATTTTFFDLDSTGFAQQTAWVSGDTGLLVRDLNSNGIIDNADELFGSPTVDGFAKLAQLDSNHDLKIDSNDSAWSSLQVWVDSNGNGVTDSGELHALASEGIVSIDLAGVASSTSTIDGNSISHTSAVTFSGGATAAIDDVWFTHSTVDTYYSGSYTPDSDTLFLPDLRGYGLLPELDISMSQDSTLKGMVEDFVVGFSFASFADPSTFDSDVSSILYRWAGVDSVDTSSRGPYVDAQDLEFLEHLFGQTFSQGGGADPQADASALIETSFQEVHDLFKADLLIQAGAGSLFDSTVSYDAFSGAIIGATHLSETGIETLATFAPGSDAPAQAFWVSVADFIDNTEGISNLTTDEQTWLDTAVTSTTTVGWDDVVSAYDQSNPGLSFNGTSGGDTLAGGTGDDTILGYGGNDTIDSGTGNDIITLGSSGNSVVHGGDGDDTINALAGNNTLYGDAGNDTIYGGTGSDTIEGGTGGNFLHGGSGNTTYVFGGGNDVINEDGGTDVILLPSGITSSDITLSHVLTQGDTHFYDLLIQVTGGSTIQIVDQFLPGSTEPQVETLEFSDSSTLDLTSLTNMTWMLTDGNDDVTITSGAGNVTVQAVGGHDTIALNNGDDIVNLGTGNKSVTGGTGDDTYLAGTGYDTIIENAGTNTIQIPTGFTMDDVTLSRVLGTPNDLLVTIAGLGEIQIVNQFYASGYGIQNLHFMGDDSWISLTDQTIDTIGTSGNNYSLSGLTVNAGGNWFDGRGGDDYVTGGIGDNTFNFSSGFGTDTVTIPYYTGNTNTLDFHGIDPSHIRMWTDSYGSLHLQDTTEPSHSITVYAGVSGSGTDQSAIGTYLEQIKFDGGTTWNVSDGLTLTASNDSTAYLYGTPYADTLIAGTGTDFLYGNGGDNTLIASSGADYMYAGSGNNTFSFSSGFNNDYIYATGSAGTNTIHLTGIDPADVRLWTDTNGYLHVEDTTNPSYNITVIAGTTGSGTHESAISDYISSITFDSSYSTTWDLTGGVTLTASNDSTYYLYGTPHGDTLIAGTGTDFMYGNGGDNTLIAGSGADYMYGGSGNNTFTFSSGFNSDYVTATADAGTNTIHLVGIDPSHIRLWTDTSGYLHIQDTTDPSYNISVAAGITGSGSDESTVGHYVQQITFDSSYGTTWDLTGGLTLTASNDTSYTLYGTAHNDTLIAGSGSDVLYGNGGDNTLIAGSGVDYMHGGSGNNTFSFSSGFNSDYVYATASAGTNTIHLAGIDPADIRIWTDSSGYLHIQDTTNPSYNISVVAGTTGTGTDESTAGTYVQQITFDSSYGTTWDLSGGITQSLSNSSGTLYGTGHGDTLNGGTGSDSFYANAGNNIISGGGGYDSVHLGTGSDTVLFKGATAETGIDTIYNFDPGTKDDKIDISDVISTYDPATDAIANFVQLATSGSDTQLKVDTDGSGTSYTQIATISGVTGLNLTDLITDGNLIVHHT
ncbi:MAG TPA: calcium-binding protein [Rhizomicrobium sp.]